jgi:hypothetical protein
VSNICNANAMMPCSSFSYSNTRGVTIQDETFPGDAKGGFKEVTNIASENPASSVEGLHPTQDHA